MSEEKQEQFQSSNICWVCGKLIDDDDEKIRDHFYITASFRGADLQLNKKVPVIFYNLRGYDSHLIFYEFNKFDVKVDIIPNRLEQYMEPF